MSTSTQTDSLHRFLAPQSIAVIGASDRPGSLGLRTMTNLEGFTGTLYPVSRRLDRIGRHRCYAALTDLPAPPDCVILAVPAAAVEQEVTACARMGAGGCIVFAAGYAELADPEGQAAQTRLAAIARDAGMRVLGPNTTGFANFATGAHAGFAEFPGGLTQGRPGIGLVSQSGALGLALAQSAQHGAQLSHVLTCGNSADIDAADLVTFLSGQPDAAAIALTFEGISTPDRLVDAVASAGKPVAICRVGTTPAGAAAVRWHTGTDPHSGYDWDTALAHAGATLVRAPEALIETATYLAKTADWPRLPERPRLAILTSSGGSGIHATDAAALAGLPLADLSPETQARLTADLPAFASPRNPCDATAQATANPPMLPRCADILLADPNVDTLILPWGKAWDSGQFPALSDLAEKHRKPICLIWMSQWHEGPGATEAEATPRLGVFRSATTCMAALAGCARHRPAKAPPQE